MSDFVWIIDFNDKSQGLYTLKSVKELDLKSPLPANEMLTTEPDLETIAVCIRPDEIGNYTMINLSKYKVEVDFDPLVIVKQMKHQILIGNRWITGAKLRSVTPLGFVFSRAGGQSFTVSEFGLGEPDDY